jgi:hypothetical protein
MAKSRRARRKQKKTRKHRGGAVNLFQVYVFTKSAIDLEEKQELITVLENLYGDVNEINDFSNFPNVYIKEDIQNFVYTKGRHYPSLKTITGFSIPVPSELNAGNMNDPKLTKQEYAIRDALDLYNAPFKLVKAQHGLWSEEIAIIALEHI